MQRKIIIGLTIGLIAGIIDVIPMILQDIPWDANLSAFSMWIVIGFFLAVVNIRINGIIRGLFISYLTIIPTLMLIGSRQPKSLIPILIMTTILGALSGFAYEKINKS